MSKIHGHQRQVLTPIGVASRKRKERDSFDVPRVPITTRAEPAASTSTAAAVAPISQPASGSGGNRLLAGYLAHEFLTKGTLFGQLWDPAAAAAARPLAGRPQDSPKQQPQQQPPSQQLAQQKKPVAYADVACLLKMEGAHIPGVINPTQLDRWLRM